MPNSLNPAEQLLTTAEAADQASRVANEALRRALQEAAAALIPVGTVVDLRQRRGLAEHFHAVKTIRGNDRGTRVFSIASAPTVRIEPLHYDSASWECQAVPISEKTGKPMSGYTHGADARDTVTIKGHFLNQYAWDDEPGKMRARFLDMLAGKLAPSQPPAARPVRKP